MLSFAKVQTTDRLINQLQNNIGASVSALSLVPLNSGILLSDVVLAAGNNTVYTTLPNTLTGWIITRQSAAVDIYDVQSTNTDPTTLILNSSGTVTVSIFLF